MYRRTALSLAGVLVLAGCATQASLTVFSQPEGAYLTEKGTGKVYGVAPTRIVYNSKELPNESIIRWNNSILDV